MRARLSVKTDNFTALAAVSYFKSKTGTGIARLARELALEFSAAEFGPDFAAHLPGVANTVADALRRLTQPKTPKTVPALLRNVTRVVPTTRTPEFFASLRPPLFQ